ncbi:CmpA/NrtA family ABC transporter substrate-binding protein [Chamaesiphon polymorphus]|uniref:Bicarbonate-binding protein n=1 Tax=Chamaesiphon polymorphus CCALA 037 TaxID=2107692 RepID=A0A2T1GHF0_9CYAN|nr:CmpA/NrtA family ABC transporter substrate-binding protein [Chamaesiphon polymorphus]PSB57122.1 bicarbonate-binding protein [Chamaesiphon polymorphus CCALA 037]
MSQFSRRKFMLTAGITATTSILINACSNKADGDKGSTATAPATNIAAGDAPEVTTAKLGFIPLTDSAPLIIAKEKGLFAKYGMKDVEVLKQTSWPVTRDNLETGSAGGGIDGAHMLSPMPYFMSMGMTKTKQPVPMYILARLNTNGQAISVANTYKDAKIQLKGAGFQQALAQAKSGGKSDLKVAVTFPGGTHDLWMRYWLSANGVDPNQDVSVVPVPPPQMVSNMKTDSMEAFCVGEPWNARLVNQKLGYTALVTGELWKDHPEKALAMRADWVDKNPKATKAILMAVQEAQQWCDKPENKEEMAKIISNPKWFDVPVADILGRIQGKIDYGDGRIEPNYPNSMKFWADNSSYPYQSHDLWFLTENMRWGNIPTDFVKAKEMIKKVNREDLWKAAAIALKVDAAQIPTSTSRGVETFFDGVKFDPAKPEEYLKSLKIKKA